MIEKYAEGGIWLFAPCFFLDTSIYLPAEVWKWPILLSQPPWEKGPVHVTYSWSMEPEGMSAESRLGQVFFPDKKRYKGVKGKTARFAFGWVCVKI